MINKLIIDKFFKEFTNHRNKTNRLIVFSYRSIPNTHTNTHTHTHTHTHTPIYV